MQKPSPIIRGNGWVFLYLFNLLTDAVNLRYWALAIIWKFHCLVSGFLNKVLSGYAIGVECIGKDMLVFHQKKVNPSSNSRSPLMPGHLGFGLMTPAQQDVRFGFASQGVSSSALWLLSHWELSPVTCSGGFPLFLSFEDNSVGGSSPLCMVPAITQGDQSQCHFDSAVHKSVFL